MQNSDWTYYAMDSDITSWLTNIYKYVNSISITIMCKNSDLTPYAMDSDISSLQTNIYMLTV